MGVVINLIILGIFIFLAFVLFRLEHIGKKAKLLILVLLGLLIYFSAFNVISSSGISITTPRGIVNAVYTYIGWIGKSMVNLWDIRHDVGDMVGDAIKMNLSEEARNLKSKKDSE